MSGRNNIVLIEFDMIRDTDIGVIEVLRKYYSKSKYINQVLLNIDNKILLSQLLMMHNINPLSLFFEDESIDIDDLYDQLFDKYCDEIIEKSTYTNMKKVVLLFKERGVTTTVLCRNKKEEQIIRNELDLYTILHNDYKEVDLKSYDAIYIKKFKDVLKFNKFNATHIYTANYAYNYDEKHREKPIQSIYAKISDTNTVRFLDIYNKKNYIIPMG